MLYWLTGDRYACLYAKDVYIGRHKKEKPYAVRYIDDVETANEFCQKINAQELFGPTNFIYVYDGSIPEPVKTTEFIEALPDNKILIVIEERPNKITKFYKKFSDKIKEFPMIKNDQGYVDRKNIDQAKKIIKVMAGWDGPDEIFDIILFESDYDYGRTVNEIQKLKVYLGEKQDWSIESISPILSRSELPDIERFKDSLNEKNVQVSMETINEIVDGSDIDANGMLVLSALIENFTFLFYARLAIEQNCDNDFKISEFIADNCIKKGYRTDPSIISKRLFFYKKYLNNYTSKKITYILGRLSNAIDMFILKECSNHHIFNRLVWDIVKP